MQYLIYLGLDWICGQGLGTRNNPTLNGTAQHVVVGKLQSTHFVDAADCAVDVTFGHSVECCSLVVPSDVRMF